MKPFALGVKVLHHSVEPLMSTNSAVTVLRSPSRLSGGAARFARIVEASDWDRTVDAVVAAASRTPQSPQKRFRSGFSDPHFEQRIEPPTQTWRPIPPLYHPMPATDHRADIRGIEDKSLETWATM
jgi:hypothetical protein